MPLCSILPINTLEKELEVTLPQDNRLEMLWTIVPAVTLVSIIFV